MTTPTVSKEEWLVTHKELQRKEKALTAEHDALAAERRRAPRMKVEKDYVFEGPDGKMKLADLFDGRSQLIVYHHMLKPNDPSPCSGCCMVGDQIPHLAHLHARDTSLVFVSRAPLSEIEAFRKRMEWQMPWVETTDSFNSDHGITDGFGLNVFHREDGDIYRTYFTSGRGMEALGTPWTFLDLTPLGRQEKWEEAPEGTPRTAPYQWWRLHDEYGANG